MSDQTVLDQPSTRLRGSATGKADEQRRILYLTEASDFAERFHSTAVELGYEVQQVDSASLGLALIADLDPELLVIDRFECDVSLEDILDALRIPRLIRPLAVIVTEHADIPAGYGEQEGIDVVLPANVSNEQLTATLSQQARVTGLQRKVLDRENEILDSMPHALIEIDKDSVVWKANRALANLFEISDPMFRKEMLGKPLAAALSRLTKGNSDAAFESLVNGLQESIRRGRRKYHGKEVLRGEERVFSGIITQLTQQNAHYLIELRDVTEDEKAVMVEARRERLATIGNLAVGAAHEIQNPNTFSRVNASNLKQLFGAIKPVLVGCGKDKIGTLPLAKAFSMVDEAIVGVETASRRIEAVLNTLKSFGRTPDGTIGSVNPKAALDEAIVLARHEARGKVELNIELPDTLPEVNAATAELSQVFLNLIQNAIKAFDLPGEQARGSGPAIVRVHVDSMTRHDLVLAVTDNGPGIEEKAKDRIFRPYYTTRRQGEGLGLGLSISSDIMQRFGGDLTVRSLPGQGASFLVAMKRADSSDKQTTIRR